MAKKARLQHYLNENKPLFTTDAQEKSWLYLLSKYSANPVQALANYTVQFADNRQYVVGATLPVLLKEGQYDAAQNCSPPSPPMKCLRSVMLSAWRPVTRLNLCVWHDCCISKNRQILPARSTDPQLMQNEQSREAADLLLQRYPFGAMRVSARL